MPPAADAASFDWGGEDVITLLGAAPVAAVKPAPSPYPLPGSAPTDARGSQEHPSIPADNGGVDTLSTPTYQWRRRRHAHSAATLPPRRPVPALPMTQVPPAPGG